MTSLPQTVLDRGSDEEMRAFTARVFQEAAPGSNFVFYVCPSAGIPMARLSAHLEDARAWAARIR